MGRVWTRPPWQSCWELGPRPWGGGLPVWGPTCDPCILMGCSLASTPGTSPELMEPETSNHSIQLHALKGAFPGSMNSALLGLPPRMTCRWEPQCLTGGTSLLRCLPPAVGMTG